MEGREEKEWDEFVPPAKLEQEVSLRMLAGIRKRTFERRAKVIFLVRRFSVAAAVILLVAAGWWYLDSREKKALPELTKNQAAAASDFVTVINSADTMQQVSLDDGSVVSLSRKASVTYTRILGKDKRDIELTGQAFFKVSKDKHRPFTVHCSDLLITVLGTSFNVKQLPTTGGVEVRLYEGKIQVSSSATRSRIKPVTLLPAIAR